MPVKDSSGPSPYDALTGPSAPDDRSTYLRRQCIGFLGAVLPIVVWILAGVRPADTVVEPWRTLDSISAYYYTSGVVALSGVLAALAVFLLTYRGFDTPDGWQDRLTAWIAGLAATTIALFPTDPARGQEPGWWRPWNGNVHYVAAAILFTCFMVFSLFLFTRTDQSTPSAGKQGRNAIYRFCGLAIGLCILWIAFFHGESHPIFVPEAMALLFFAVSWLTKGRVDRTASVVARKVASRAKATLQRGK